MIRHARGHDIRDNELYQSAPLEVKVRLLQDPRFLDRVMLVMALDRGDAQVEGHPLLASEREKMKDAEEFYHATAERFGGYFDTLYEEFRQRREERLAPYRQAYETEEAWDGDLANPPKAVRDSGFHRYPKYVDWRVAALKGKDRSKSETAWSGDEELRAHSDTLDHLFSQQNRYGEVFDRYYRGNTAFRQWANKLSEVYPKQETDRIRRKNELEDRKELALHKAKRDIQRVVQDLSSAGHSREAIQQIVRDAIKDA